MSWGYRAGGTTREEDFIKNNKYESTQNDGTKVYRTYGGSKGINQYELIVFLKDNNNSSCIIKSKVFKVFIRIDNIPNFKNIKDLYKNIVLRMDCKYKGIYNYSDLEIRH